MQIDWYNEYRAHMTLDGSTPNEVYHDRRRANRRPRIETRKSWPRGSPCARPRTLVAGQPGATFTLEVTRHEQRQHLPLIALRRAA